MRGLIWTVAVLAVLWAGLWVVAAKVTDNALADWIAAQNGAITAKVSVAGFPNRVDITASDVVAGDTGFGPGWQAPFVQVFAMAWKPWHLIAALPTEQTITLPGGWPVSVGSDKLQSSLVLVPGTALALDRLNVAGDALRLGGVGAGEPLRIETLRLAVHRHDTVPGSLRLGLEASGILPPAAFRAMFPSGRSAPEGPGDLRMDALAELTGPLDRTVLEAPPRLLALDIGSLTLDWGALSLSAKGRLGVDDGGYLSGQLDLDIAGWRTGLDLAVAAGALQPGVADTWAAFAEQLQDPATGRLTLPMVWRNGTARFGPLPVGVAPRIEG
jgi:hypothetical protein